VQIESLSAATITTATTTTTAFVLALSGTGDCTWDYSISITLVFFVVMGSYTREQCSTDTGDNIRAALKTNKKREGKQMM
jgi:hypothetical protein